MEFQDQKTYHRAECAVFLKTADHFGGLSNMAGGYSLSINNIHIPTSEALYQACRFPHKSELQKIIIGQKSPMTAKMKSKPYRKDSRPDWDEVRVEIMRWCLHVKLAQHWEKFGNLLLSTGNKLIVEESHRDQFWGAKPINSENLVGVNILGQLLTTLREELKGPDIEKLRVVEPPNLTQFLLIDKPIGLIEGKACRDFSYIKSSELPLTTELFMCDNDHFVEDTSNAELKQSDESSVTLTLSNAPISQNIILIQLVFDY